MGRENFPNTIYSLFILEYGSVADGDLNLLIQCAIAVAELYQLLIHTPYEVI